MTSPSAVELTRAVIPSALILRGFNDLNLSGWRLFGSWAMALQSRWFSRFPNDLDIEVQSEADLGKVHAGWRLRHGPLELAGSPARVVTFSSPQRLVATWQEVTGMVNGQVTSRELVNWVWREPLARGRSDLNCSAHDAERISGHAATTNHLALDRIYPLEECFAQKWTRVAITRSGGRRHTRWLDVADVFDIAILGAADLDSSDLIAQMRAYATARGLPWPPALPSPPEEWLDSWDMFGYQSHIDRGTPSMAVTKLNEWLSVKTQGEPSVGAH